MAKDMQSGNFAMSSLKVSSLQFLPFFECCFYGEKFYKSKLKKFR